VATAARFGQTKFAEQMLAAAKLRANQKQSAEPLVRFYRIAIYAICRIKHSLTNGASHFTLCVVVVRFCCCQFSN